MDSFNIGLYCLTAILLAASALKDRAKTRAVLIRSWQSFLRILPEFVAIMALMGTALAFLPAHVLAGIIGEQAGWTGLALASVLGSIGVLPGFVVFPLGKSLLDAGAGTFQVVLLISTLMTVSITTLPAESEFFGRRAAVLRNGMSFLYAFVAALAVSLVVQL